MGAAPVSVLQHPVADIVQQPRIGRTEPYEALATARSEPFSSRADWQLTNTRYLLGPAGFLDGMNEQLDPGQHRFRIIERFQIVPKPGVDAQELQRTLKKRVVW